MKLYAGIDVSLEACSLCVVDESGEIIKEGKCASEPEALIGWFQALAQPPERIGLEAGPLSQWLYAGMKQAGLAVVLLETRHVRDAFKSAPVKTDRKDARGLAQLVRMNWFRPVHCKSREAQESRALMTARSQLRARRHDIDMSLRGILRGFGLKVGKTTPRTFPARVRELSEGRAALELIAAGMLAARDMLETQYAVLDKRLRAIARTAPAVRLLMTAPGVGPLVALGYASAVDDPSRIGKSRNVGAYFGLTQKRYQSGEIDRAGAISKCGDADVRALLYEAANVILTKPVKAGPLKSWALKLARRVGPRRAKVALARKLAVILHRMWRDGTAFDATLAAAA